MRKIILTILYTIIFCVGITKISAQDENPEGGGGFTVDGLQYEIVDFNPNIVELISGTFTNPFIIPSIVTFDDVDYTVVEIGFNSFNDNPTLTSVTLPATIIQINNEAFANSGLTEVITLGTEPATVQGNSFGVRSSINLTVPIGAEESYLDNGWTGFATINGTTVIFEVNNITYGINSIAGNTVSVQDTSLTGSVAIPATVTFNGTVYTITKIADNALENKQLTSITMPNTITSIGDYAFRDNQLGSATLSNTLETIGADAFRNNELTSVTLSNTLETIGQNAFRNNQLTSVMLANTLTSLGARAFQNNQIVSVDIPESVVVMEDSVFRENNLATINLAEGITTIKPFAFDDNNLTSVTIPASVTRIQSFGFSNNPLTDLTSLATTPPVIDDPNFTFGNFNSLGSIDLTIPDGTEAAYDAAGWTGFRSVNGEVILVVGFTFTENNFDYTITSMSPNEVEITGGTSIPQNLIIDATITTQETDFSVVRVGTSAFENVGLTSVQLPNTMRVIENFAFQSNQITNLTIPDGVTTISFRAFRLNQIGGSVIIPNSVTSMGNAAFEANNLSSVAISENLSAIGNHTFRSNQLTTVTIPANINSLGDSCFRSNPLTEVIVLNTTPPSILTGNDDAFNGTRGNIALTVPTNTELNYLTNGWTGFATINGEDPAFFNEFEVANITYRIKTLNPNELEIADSTLSGEVVIPNMITDNGQDYTVSSIGVAAFRDNQLTTVTIPASVTTIGAMAFRNNTVTTVIVEGAVPPTIDSRTNSNNTFTNRANIEVFVPTGTEQAYSNGGWTNFKSVVGASKALQLKVYLQGASLNPNIGEETLMRDDLRIADLIPFISPYGDGLVISDTIYVEQTEGPDAIVDWVFIEIRDSFNNTIIIESSAALLQRDGDIVGMDAISPIQFATIPDTYFITIKHRNHLGIMLADAKRLSPVITTIDFADATDPIAFGNNAQTTAGMPANTLGMWTGNVNGDNIVQYSGTDPDVPAILSLVLNDSGNFLNFSTFIVSGYNTNDLNLDGNVQYEGVSPDAPFILQNVLAHPGNFLNFSTFQIIEQLPDN
ncbi:leucine-rich repeat protein [Kordia sp.]|uniref:leucine-rich repeat protein n=1 Tax=Kordia sp. TaxID=1965332 RepID=UPI003D2B3AE9